MQLAHCQGPKRMDNQNIQKNQVIVVNNSDKNPWLVSLEGYKSKERSSLVKERQEFSSDLSSKLPLERKKKHRKRESSTDSGSSREVSPQVILHLLKKKKYGKKRRQ